MFLDSLFTHIDKTKFIETIVYSNSKQVKLVNEILKKNHEKFWKNDYSIEFSIKKYFNDKIQFYKILIENKDIKVKNIVIFNWVVKFFIQNLNVELKNEDSNVFWFKDINWFWILNNWNWIEYKFKNWKNTYHIVKESIERWYWEMIDFIDLIEILEWNKDQDKNKMVYNAVSYANKKIQETFKIKDFFLVEEKAYKRQYLVNNK